MTARLHRLALAAAMLALPFGCTPSAPPPAAGSGPVLFDYFAYEGNDPVFADAMGPNEMRNPILTGFYPDPSITQVGGDYYLVNSTFCYFPGIPVWHSTDLVNWTQIGNVIDRPGMLDFDGLGLSRGVFAPTINHHDDVFFVANTCVDCGGNFIVTAADPAGPWTDPVWVPDVGGIDPSLFWDTDGKMYLMNNDEPEGGSTYDGHRAIWIREIDPQTFQPVSEPVMIINGGARPEDKPIWIEGPHIYKVDDGYLFSAAEGGTAVGHSQVLFKAPAVTGPYAPYAGNPVLTQRDLPEDRPQPVTSVGHAEFVQDASGNWWAAFLGVRPYRGDLYNTGRETFLLPVTWTDGWPVILEAGKTVPYSLQRPDLPASDAAVPPTTGNFSIREDFDSGLPKEWLAVRVPAESWYAFEGGALELSSREASIGSGLQPSLLGYRQKHTNATAETELRVFAGDEAGIAAFQNDNYFLALTVSGDANGQTVRLMKKSGEADPERGTVLAETRVPAPAGSPVKLRIEARGGEYDFSYSTGDSDWQALATDVDGSILSTQTAGGFIGSVFGLFAQTQIPVSD